VSKMSEQEGYWDTVLDAETELVKCVDFALKPYGDKEIDFLYDDWGYDLYVCGRYEGTIYYALQGEVYTKEQICEQVNRIKSKLVAEEVRKKWLVSPRTRARKKKIFGTWYSSRTALST